MKFSKKTLLISLILTVIILLFIGIITNFLYSELLEKFRYENIRGIATALIVYANDYDDLPPLNNWCDQLIEKADCSPLMFQGVIDRQEGACGYALNKNLDSLKFTELNDKVVLAFEAKGPWNLSGGPELTKNTPILVTFN